MIARNINTPDFQGQLPIPKRPRQSAAPQGNIALDDNSRAILEKLGWQDGMPIPADIGERLRNAVLAVTGKQVKVITPADITPEVQTYLKDLFTEVAEPSPVSAIPDTPQPDANTPDLIDDWKPADVEDAPDPEPPKSSATPETPKICPRCQWPTDLPFEVTITDEDRENFVLSAFSREGRFVKTFTYMNGLLEITLQTLTADEVSDIDAELGHMLQVTQEIVTSIDYAAWALKFRTALMVKTIKMNGTAVYSQPSYELSDRDSYDGIAPPTGLKQYLDKVHKLWPASEPSRRVIGQAARHFITLVEGLEATISNENFT